MFCPSWASTQLKLEWHAANLVLGNNSEAVTGMLTEHSNDAAATAVSSYLALFETLVARYHDGYFMKASRGVYTSQLKDVRGGTNKYRLCCYSRDKRRRTCASCTVHMMCVVDRTFEHRTLRPRRLR